MGLRIDWEESDESISSNMADNGEECDEVVLCKRSKPSFIILLTKRSISTISRAELIISDVNFSIEFNGKSSLWEIINGG